MSERLTAIDASFLYLEDATTPMHVGSVVLFHESPGAMDHERLVRLIRDRIAFVPRYRQRVREVPGRLALPVWVDDTRFDVGYHVRRSALPAPGSLDQLCELVGRIMSRPLDRRHPLWEVYLIEGLADDRFAILTKSHQAMVDGIAAVDIAEVILDDTDEPRATPKAAWRPAPEPTSVELLTGALGDALSHPFALAGRMQHTLDSARRGLGDIVATVAEGVRGAESNPLAAPVGQQRRFAMLEARLDDVKAVRASLGGTVNDVVLAVIAGGLRSWLLSRGEPVGTDTLVRTLLPVSVTDDDDRASRVDAFLVDLPVGEPDPVVRLQRVTYDMARHHESGQAVGARAMVDLVGFAPPTLHTLGARVGASLSRRSYSLIVTNVPGPQGSLFAGGARMVGAYPVVPLGARQALAIGVTSYSGGLFLGFNADRDLVPDLAELVDCVEESLAELAGAGRARGGRRLRVARGRST